MKHAWIVAMIAACSKSEPEPQTVGSSGSSAGPQVTGSSASAGSKKSAASDLPPRTAPGTPEILAAFDAACDGGTATACFDSGMRRAKGMGTTPSKEAAVPWFEKGCKLDDPEACTLLGSFYGLGDGVTKDARRAIELHRKACPRVAHACRLAANYYFEGTGVPNDDKAGVDLLETACLAKDGESCEQLANRAANGDGIAKDAGLAVGFATKACDLGARYCETLGAFHIGGTGVAKDGKKGVSLVEKACAAGSTKACDGAKILRGD